MGAAPCLEFLRRAEIVLFGGGTAALGTDEFRALHQRSKFLDVDAPGAAGHSAQLIVMRPLMLMTITHVDSPGWFRKLDVIDDMGQTTDRQTNTTVTAGCRSIGSGTSSKFWRERGARRDRSVAPGAPS